MAAGLTDKKAADTPDPARLSAFGILQKLAAKNVKLERLLADWAGRETPSEKDRAFVSEIVYGVTRWTRGLDAVIDAVSSRPTKEISIPTLIILRMGAYQLMGMDRTPDHAAVNETVNLTKAIPESRRATGFVNAVLREIIRKGYAGQEIIHVVPRLRKKGKAGGVRLGEKLSFPDWLALRWVKRFGEETAGRLMETLNERAPVHFRVNTLRITPEDFEKRFKDWSVQADRVDFFPLIYKLNEGRITPTSQIFTGGYTQPQDAGSALAASLLDAKPGDTVVEACCGIGVKTGFFAQEMQNSGKIVCIDNVAAKLFAHRRNMRRLSAKICVAVTADVSKPWPFKRGFKKIFVDAPCTGTGVLRRHPEGKWNKTPDSVERMARIQKQILKNAADALAPGGVLVYAVCSIEPDEGTDVVNSVIAEHGGLRRDDIVSSRPELARFINPDGDLFIFPGEEGMDGFYAARLVKKG